MSQADLGTIVASTTSGTALATLLNAWENALESTNKGSSAPSYVQAGLPWIDDTTSGLWILKRYDGANWLIEGYFDTTNHVFLQPLGGGSATIGSASTVDLWSVASSDVVISGNTSITALTSSGQIAGTLKTVLLTGTPLITFNATSLITPNGLDIQPSSAGDTMIVKNLGGGNVRVIHYTRANGQALSENSEKDCITITGSTTLTLAHAGTTLFYNSASAGNLTVPPASSVPWVKGMRINFQQEGAGILTVVAGLAVTVNGNKKTTGAWTAGSLVYKGSDVWNTIGTGGLGT